MFGRARHSVRAVGYRQFPERRARSDAPYPRRREAVWLDVTKLACRRTGPHLGLLATFH